MSASCPILEPSRRLHVWHPAWRRHSCCTDAGCKGLCVGALQGGGWAGVQVGGPGRCARARHPAPPVWAAVTWRARWRCATNALRVSMSDTDEHSTQDGWMHSCASLALSAQPSCWLHPSCLLAQHAASMSPDRGQEVSQMQHALACLLVGHATARHARRPQQGPIVRPPERELPAAAPMRA